MGGPAGVGDADVDIVGLVKVQAGLLSGDLLLKVAHLPLLLHKGGLLVGLAAVDADAWI